MSAVNFTVWLRLAIVRRHCCLYGAQRALRRRRVAWQSGGAIQPPQVLTVLQVLTTDESPANSSGAVLALRGRRLEDESLIEAKQGSLKRLFQAMLDVVDRGLSVQMYPDFNPSLAWLATDEKAMCTLLPLDGPVPAEVDQVRLVAKAFYRFATGIEHGQLAGGVPALLRWSKFGGEELSRIVDRCLAPASSKACITTLSGLNNALGRERARGTEFTGQFLKAAFDATVIRNRTRPRQSCWHACPQGTFTS